jgi:hypothetical protein
MERQDRRERLERDSDEIRELSDNVIRLQEQISTLQGMVKIYVTRAEFTPVKMIVYGLAGTVMTSVLLAILSRVIGR